MKGYAFLLLATFLACNRNSFPSSVTDNQKTFMEHLNVIKRYETSKSDVSVLGYQKAVIYLSVITTVESKARYSSTIGYEKREDYEKDMKEWKKWFNANKAILTNEYVDSAFL